ncbi:hypothetical protein [Flavobacterium sp.]|uniref:hypothetical protein n=1 Tax=Flavobacterium sp. TaxID=239 RepID=UPI002C989492|nr:hypothetical protein [Flavobacterium sp.]HSD07344.1 hypothetical protein [Flavobacterium sp.]
MKKLVTETWTRAQRTDAVIAPEYNSEYKQKSVKKYFLTLKYKLFYSVFSI